MAFLCKVLWVHYLICSCDIGIDIFTSPKWRLRLREDGDFPSITQAGSCKGDSQTQVPASKAAPPLLLPISTLGTQISVGPSGAQPRAVDKRVPDVLELSFQ